VTVTCMHCHAREMVKIQACYCFVRVTPSPPTIRWSLVAVQSGAVTAAPKQACSSYLAVVSVILCSQYY
jgi:hypothetical protein